MFSAPKTSFGFGTNTVRQKGARTAAQASGVGPQWVYFNYITGKFEVDIVRVGKPNFTISGNDATELKNNYLSGMKNTASSGIGIGMNMARSMFGKKGGKSRKNRKTNARKNRTRRN